MQDDRRKNRPNEEELKEAQRALLERSTHEAANFQVISASKPERKKIVHPRDGAKSNQPDSPDPPTDRFS
jgi:hypothetical protein